jgi:hypothetical protein
VSEHKIRFVLLCIKSIDIKIKIDCLGFVMCPLLALPHPRIFFFFFILQPFTVLMRQTRQAVHAIKQSISLDVYGLVNEGGQGKQAFSKVFI